MKDYWKKFDLLCSELENEEQHALIIELREAQSYNNGLTDGWYDFLQAFQKAIQTYKLSEFNKKLADNLIETLRLSLENR